MNIIYKISIAHKYYYGQTTQFKKRRRSHLNALKQGTHCNPYMQNCFNKYDDFSMEVIATVTSAEHLDEVEQYYIDAHIDEVDCMNLARYVDSPMRGRKHSAETKAKVGAASKGRKAKLCFGRPKGTEDWIQFASRTAAAEHVGGNKAHISKCIKGKLKSHKGWEWRGER